MRTNCRISILDMFPQPDSNDNVPKGSSNVTAVVRRDDLSESELRREKFRVMRNVVLISFSFLLLFTAFQSMANLQSSINKVSKFMYCIQSEAKSCSRV